MLRVAFTHFLSSNPPECQDWGAGGSSQSWQCQDSESFCYSHPSLTAAVVTASHWHYVHLTFTSSEFAQLMLQQLRQVYTKSCNYKIANNLDYVQTSRCVHIHYVQTRHCVHIVYVQTSTFIIITMINHDHPKTKITSTSYQLNSDSSNVVICWHSGSCLAIPYQDETDMYS